jgi:hypothetical protein
VRLCRQNETFVGEGEDRRRGWPRKYALRSSDQACSYYVHFFPEDGNNTFSETLLPTYQITRWVNPRQSQCIRKSAAVQVSSGVQRVLTVRLGRFMGCPVQCELCKVGA